MILRLLLAASFGLLGSQAARGQMQPPLPPVFLPRLTPSPQPSPTPSSTPSPTPMPAIPAPPPQARLQLHHCSAQWSKMKHSGEASGKLWRDFALDCMKK